MGPKAPVIINTFTKNGDYKFILKFLEDIKGYLYFGLIVNDDKKPNYTETELEFQIEEFRYKFSLKRDKKHKIIQISKCKLDLNNEPHETLNFKEPKDEILKGFFEELISLINKLQH